MKTKEAIDIAAAHLQELVGHSFDVLSISRPATVEAAVNLTKVVSKLSPLLGNLIEFNTVEFLNDISEFQSLGHWKRQDPDFPDALFEGKISPAPGFEIKAWFPLATEITARFRDSQNHFKDDQTYVALLAWLPEMAIYGMPKVIGVCVVSGKSVAEARDRHYHNPPDYIVVEPKDTSARTRNLQQTNTAGYKWQGSEKQFAEAEKIVASWGPDGKMYVPTAEYQTLLQGLVSRFEYRLDTNFAKMDRIEHPEVERFKGQILGQHFQGMTVGGWAKLFGCDDEARITAAMKTHLKIQDRETAEILL